jgi:hypothetical protein
LCAESETIRAETSHVDRDASCRLRRPCALRTPPASAVAISATGALPTSPASPTLTIAAPATHVDDVARRDAPAASTATDDSRRSPAGPHDVLIAVDERARSHGQRRGAPGYSPVARS